jgi:hypothetical protein
MRLLITICLCLSGLVGFTQSKPQSSSSSSTEERKERTKAVTETIEMKSTVPSAQKIERKRESAPKRSIERSKEMLERKKQAPLLNEPQH